MFVCMYVCLTDSELDSTRMNGLTDDKKRSVVPTAQSKQASTSDRLKLGNG